MSLRPQPVTSKFRQYYFNEILPIYHNRKLSHSNSSAGSTSSLTSILNHDSCPDDLDAMERDSFDNRSISINENDLQISNFPEESFKRLNFTESNEMTSKKLMKSKKPNGIFREILKPNDDRFGGSLNSSNHKNRPDEKSCKRIIARKPDYPGSRVTQVSYQGVPSVKRNRSVPPMSRNNSNTMQKKANVIINQTRDTKTENIASDNSIGSRPIQRTTAKKKSDSKAHIDNDVSVKSISETSEAVYSANDFSSVSDQNNSGSQIKTGAEKSIDDRNISSADNNNDANSVSDDRTISSVSLSHLGNDKTPQRIPSAWEDWYLKKEKHEREKLEKERQHLAAEETKKQEEIAAKEKRKEVCQAKISEWLKKKEEERLKRLKNLKKEKKKNQIKELEKDDKLKKSSKKYVDWKLKKLNAQKEQERLEKENNIKKEAEKMIKDTRAQAAFKEWFSKHKDHHLPVPYSYGISDGKLTSYYDKTSNPPPTFFNPKPWISVIQTSN